MVIDNPKLETIIENLKVNLNNISEKDLNDEDKEIYLALKFIVRDTMSSKEYEKFLENN